ncbi:hypothetical protein MMC27_003782 [Xylographa pallens]|nr:hypothetical protein [Xylographa pallens]
MVPPELCQVLPGQIAKCKLSMDQTSGMIKAAARLPKQNTELISEQGSRLLGLDNADGLRKFFPPVVPEMITVTGRLLPLPSLQYRNTRRLLPSGGQWNMVNQTFIVPVSLHYWTYLHMMNGPEDEFHGIDSKFANLSEMMGKCGIDIKPIVHAFPPLGINLRAHYEPDIHKKIKYIMDKVREHQLKNNMNVKQLQLLFIFLPRADTALYKAIKKYADTELGVQTLCMVKKKFQGPRGADQYLANIALKVNLKLGGINHMANPDSLGIIEKGKTMLLGIDVTHPAPGSDATMPSIAACVANTDQRCGQWLGSVDKQEGRQEMVENLEAMVSKRLKVWASKNGSFPENLIVHRDGVSEGQYDTVLKTEESAITMAMEKAFLNSRTQRKAKFHISLIIVGKQHHTRFYPTNKVDANKKGNPLNGLVIHRGITSHVYWDFYLQAHAAGVDSAKPTHYVVIKDDIKLGVDALEKITHSLCYLWNRATKSVSICPPAYYTDILCTRARCYLRDEVDETASGASRTVWALPQEEIARTMYYI